MIRVELKRISPDASGRKVKRHTNTFYSQDEASAVADIKIHRDLEGAKGAIESATLYQSGKVVRKLNAAEIDALGMEIQDE